MSDTSTVIQIVVPSVGLLVNVAVLKVLVANLDRRVDDLEECNKKLPDEYVPRRELQALLLGIERTVKQIGFDVQTALRIKRQRQVERREGVHNDSSPR